MAVPQVLGFMSNRKTAAQQTYKALGMKQSYYLMYEEK
ncbi:hypothetical protein SPWS13_1836 [Shewanella putrefaciens]|nr:hypothetical protein SPWS13_1836 [Shewanella putrefaciens]